MEISKEMLAAGGVAGAGAAAGGGHAARAALGAGVMDKLLNIAMRSLDPERPPVVSAAAARLLLALSGGVRPPGLVQTPQYTELIAQFSSEGTHAVSITTRFPWVPL